MNAYSFGASAKHPPNLVLLFIVITVCISIQSSVVLAQDPASCTSSDVRFNDIIDDNYPVIGSTVGAIENFLNNGPKPWDFKANSIYNGNEKWVYGGSTKLRTIKDITKCGKHSECVEITQEKICLDFNPTITKPKFKNSLMDSCWEEWSDELYKHELEHVRVDKNTFPTVHKSFAANPIAYVPLSKWEGAGVDKKNVLMRDALDDVGHNALEQAVRPGQNALDSRTNHGESADKFRPVLDCGTKLVFKPQDICLKGGETQHFMAYANTDYSNSRKLVSVKDSALVVKWSPAELFVDNIFTAPKKSGTIEVTAHVETLSASTTVRIGDCGCNLVGTWSLRMGSFLEGISALSGTAAKWNHISGESLLTLDKEGGFQAQRIALKSEITVEGQTLIMVVNSTESGTYITNNATITMNEMQSNAKVELIHPILGMIPGLPGSSEFSAPGGLSGKVHYECGGDNEKVLKVTTDGVVAIFDRLKSIPK